METGHLPESLKPIGTEKLLRLGRDFDGGYIVSSQDVINSNILISFGIYDDWSFEQDFQKIKNVPVRAYDGSVTFKLFLYLTIKAFFGFTGTKSMLHWLKTAIKFKYFFSGQNSHNKLYVSPIVGEKYISYQDIVNKLNTKNIFLKIDIEGGEYRILESILQNKNLLVGLVIEFHDVDLHVDKIIKFSNLLGMKIIHLHANNSAGLVGKEKTPVVIEITYGSLHNVSKDSILTSELDKPNDPKLREIKIEFIKDSDYFKQADRQCN